MHNKPKGEIMRIFKKTALFLAVLTVLSAFSVFAEQNTAQKKFSDVTESTPYSSDISKLTDAGILNGYEDVQTVRRSNKSRNV